MSRSRRSYRRSSSQQAVSLLASVLPSPLRQVADTQIGSTLMMLGVPALVVGGILQFNWEGGLPHFSIDPNRAAELEQAARNEFGRIGNPGTIQQLERTAVEFWNSTQGQQPPYGSRPYSNDSGFPTSQPATNAQYDWRAQSQQYALPSSSAAKYVSTQTQSQPQGNPSTNAYSNSSHYQQQVPQQQAPQQQAPQQQAPQQQAPQQPTYYQQQSYQQSQSYPAQQQDQQQHLNYQQPQQQPYYQQPTYQQPTYQQPQSYQSQNYGQWRQ